MTMDFAERMTVDGTVYWIDTFALEPYRKSLPSPPASSRGPAARTAIMALGRSGNADLSASCS